MMDEFSAQAAILRNDSIDAQVRVSVALRLGNDFPLRARELLIEIASSPDDDARVLEAVGRALARCSEVTSSYLTEWDCRDMTEVAYETYWAEVP